MLNKIGSTPPPPPTQHTQLKRNSNPSFGTIERYIIPANSIFGSLPIKATIPLILEADYLNKILTHLKSIDRSSWELEYTSFLKLYDFRLKNNPDLSYLINSSPKGTPRLSICFMNGESATIYHDPNKSLESKWHYQRVFGFFRKLAKDINKKD